MPTLRFILCALIVLLALAVGTCGCGGVTQPSGAADAASDHAASDASGSCASGVCGMVSGAQCAELFASSDCLGGMCCVLAADSGPPFIDAAVDCFCVSPDDLGCEHWYRYPGGPGGTCGYGSLCCGSAGNGDR